MQIARYATVLLLCGQVVACGNAADPQDPTPAVGEPQASATSTGRRGELIAAYREQPGNQSIIDELEALDRESREQAGQIMEIEVAPDHVVYVLEPKEGGLLLLEGGKRPATSVVAGFDVDSPQPLTRLFAALRPGEALPAVLAEAEQRHEAGSDADVDALEGESAPAVPMEGAPAPAMAPAAAGPSVTPQHVTSSGGHFRDDQHGCVIVDEPVRSFCWLERSGGWSEPQKATHSTQVLAMFAGDIMTWRLNNTFKIVRPGDFFVGSPISRKHCPIIPITPCVLRNMDMISHLADAETFVDMWHWGGSYSQDTNVHVFAADPAPDRNK